MSSILPPRAACLRTSRASSAVLFLVLFAASGCANGDVRTIVISSNPPPSPNDAGTTETTETQAPTPELPPGITFPEVKSRGGAVLSTPRVLPIVFKGDPLAGQIDSFTKNLASSGYWSSVAGEYGVGNLTALPLKTMNETPPTTIDANEIASWLASKLGSSSSPLGVPDADTIYAVFYPAGVSVTNEGQSSCSEFEAFHSEFTAKGSQLAYAVMPRCPGSDGHSALDELTISASHEYFEAATDPFVTTDPAYMMVDDRHWAWEAMMFGELSDLCTFLDRDFLTPPDVGFMVQRQWSNKLSKIGANPCAPAKQTPYVQAILEPTDTVKISDAVSGTRTVGAIRVSPGKTRTVEAYVHADRKTSDAYALDLMPLDEFNQRAPTRGFKYSAGASTVHAGDHIKVTISAPTTTSSDILVATIVYPDDVTTLLWPVFVVNY